MPQRALNHSAKRYAEYWERRERAFVERLADGDEGTRLLALQRAAGYFRIALATPHANYDAYVERWRDAYTQYAHAIRAACDSLPLTSGLAADPKARSERARAGIDHEWFRRRVFDIYLWSLGAAKQRLTLKPHRLTSA